MYFSLIITFLLLLAIVITSIQNSMPLEIRFFFWNHEMSLTALIFYSSLLGGAVVAVLTLPKLVKKSLEVRRLNREMFRLNEQMMGLEKGHAGGSPAG